MSASASILYVLSNTASYPYDIIFVEYLMEFILTVEGVNVNVVVNFILSSLCTTSVGLILTPSVNDSTDIRLVDGYVLRFYLAGTFNSIGGLCHVIAHRFCHGSCTFKCHSFQAFVYQDKYLFKSWITCLSRGTKLSAYISIIIQLKKLKSSRFQHLIHTTHLWMLLSVGWWIDIYDIIVMKKWHLYSLINIILVSKIYFRRTFPLHPRHVNNFRLDITKMLKKTD